MVAVGSLGLAGGFRRHFIFFLSVPKETLTLSQPAGETGWAPVSVGLFADFSASLSREDGLVPSGGAMGVLNTWLLGVATSKAPSWSLSEREVLRATAKRPSSGRRAGRSDDMVPGRGGPRSRQPPWADDGEFGKKTKKS